MDPPDVLGVDLSAARPTQLPGRAKSEQLFRLPPARQLHETPPVPVPCCQGDGPDPLLCLCCHLLFADGGGSWGDGACCHLAVCHCQQRGRPVALPGWTLPCCPSSGSLVPSQPPVAGLPGTGGLSGATVGRELGCHACAATPLNLQFSLGRGGSYRHRPCALPVTGGMTKHAPR